MTHPPGFGLIFECFLGVLGGSLDVVHRVLHMVLNPVDHLALQSDVNFRASFS